MDADYTSEFADIGGGIDRRWRREGFHPDAFAGIAAEAAATLTEIDLDRLLIRHHDRLDLSYRFSDFDLRIFANDRLRIEILYWLGGSTSIHQHAFGGAFKLLAGRSVHVEYDFTTRCAVHPELLIGDLTPRRSEILDPGAVRRIDRGARFIHANFHLVRPTVTMVIRTHRDTAVNGPQFDYHYPHVATDPLFNKDRRTRQQRLIELIARTGRWELVDQAIEAVWPDPTVDETLDILRLPVVLSDPTRLERALARAADRHPAYAAELAATTREDLRREKGHLLFRRVAGAEQRFFVALLINLQDAETIMRHLAEEFPDEAPAAVAARLLADIAVAGHLPAIPVAEMTRLVEVIDGRRRPAEAPELRSLLDEDVLRPLFSRHPSPILPAIAGRFARAQPSQPLATPASSTTPRSAR